VVVENTGLDKTILPFLFGRPLTETMRYFKIKLVRTASGVSVISAPVDLNLDEIVKSGS
jgi:hypothetical protein